jgi:hypothetical protein
MGYMPRIRIALSQGKFMFGFGTDCQISFPNWLYQFVLSPTVKETSSCPNSHWSFSMLVRLSMAVMKTPDTNSVKEELVILLMVSEDSVHGCSFSVCLG